MNKIFFLFLLLFPVQALGETPRLKMTQDVSRDKDASHLMESVSAAARSGDFDSFVKHFTKKYSVEIRKKMESLFSSYYIDMRVIDCRVESCDDEKMKVRLRYIWGDGFKKKIIVSDVGVQLEDDKWKIASESVVETKNNEPNHPVQFNFGGGGQVNFVVDEDMLPKDMPRIKGGCANGKCGIARSQPINAPYNPSDMLPKDMPKIRGGGCANGRCGVR